MRSGSKKLITIAGAILLGLAGVAFLSGGGLVSPANSPLAKEVLGRSVMPLGAPEHVRAASSSASSPPSSRSTGQPAAKPWARNTSRLLARDYAGLIRDAAIDPAAGSYYYAGQAAFACYVVNIGGGLQEILDAIRRETAKNPDLARKREAAALSYFAPCEGATKDEWMALADKLRAEAIAAGDPLALLARDFDTSVFMSISPASIERKQDLVRAALFSGDPSLVRRTVGAFGPGSGFEGETLQVGESLDPGFTDAMTLMLCANFGACGWGGLTLEGACAKYGRCEETIFSALPQILPQARWARTEHLYYRIQGALGANDREAFVIRLFGSATTSASRKSQATAG